MSDLFPTRNSPAQGDASERTMAEKVDACGFRTVIRNNPDGSVTMLRTRGGALDYTTTPAPTGKPIEPVPKLRGFVAHKTDAGSGVAFDPTQWTSVSGIYNEPKIIDRKFSPVIKTYYVSELTTEHNALAAGTTQWQDVWTLTSGSLRINNIAPTFLGNYTLPTFSGIPFFIPIDGTYGTLVENAGQVKRIFVVGRDKVEAVTDGTMSEAPAVELCSKVARNDRRAMTCGPAIDRAENKAVLSQLFYTGYSWDSIDSGWAMGITEVAMLLTPPHLNQVDSYPSVGQATAIPQIQPHYTNTVVQGIELPEVKIGVYGIGEVGPTNPAGASGYIYFPWRGPVIGKIDTGYRTISQDGSHWVGVTASAQNIGGEIISVSAGTDLKFLSNFEYLRHDNYTHFLFNSLGTSIANEVGSYDAPTGVTTWSSDLLIGFADFNPKGIGEITVRQRNIGEGCYFTSVDQSGNFNITKGSVQLVSGAFSWGNKNGQTVSPVVGMDHYQQYLDSPYGQIGQSGGFGDNVDSQIRVEYGGAVENIPAAYAAAMARINMRVGNVLYDMADNNPIGFDYFSAVASARNTTTKTLNWTTRDYLLYDKAEQVYVYVLGTFDAVAPNAMLTVELVIKTPHAESRKTLYQTTFWYDEMLPTQELQSGVQYIPLPRLSVFFTPKYRHQGDFRGAAYTTTTEEALDGEVPGATPVCLMNFILTLQMFDYIGTQEQQDSLQKGVDEQFVPCNLLEMLYAYVFSSDYGQNDYSRYPVTYRNNFNKLYAELFNVQHAIAFKDGAFVDWAASITGHNPSTTTGIYRT